MTLDNSGERNSPIPAESSHSDADGISTGRAAYNVVSDTVTGVNVRASDNLLQALFILAAVILLAIVGAVLAALNSDWDLPWYAGAMLGAFAGLVIGFFASGIFLMIYRAVRHMTGKHD
jgi:hypothetical protein